MIKQNARGTAGDNRVNCNRIPRAAVYDIPPAPPGDSAGQKIALIAMGLNSSPPEQNGPHFRDDIFRCIFVNENFYILIESSLKFVSNGPIDNHPILV